MADLDTAEKRLSCLFSPLGGGKATILAAPTGAFDTAAEKQHLLGLYSGIDITVVTDPGGGQTHPGKGRGKPRGGVRLSMIRTSLVR